MTTPIADFVRSYASSDTSRFHMPGHKGQNILGCEGLDITEIRGADVLGSASGIIAESEANAASLFGSAYTLYSTEGSSLCIRAMMALIKKRGGKNAKILAARNAHKAFIYACALCDVDVEWIYPEGSSHLCSCHISPEMLEEALTNTDKPSAVYITSPDYLGNIADVKGLSEVCHKHGIPLLVDNAHGAYLAFRSPSEHPITLGADMCCDSAHKTLPVLTGGAYLHISKEFNLFSAQKARNAMSLFASTSPSYLILQSLDLCNAYLADGYKERLEDFVKKIDKVREELSSMGFTPVENTEALKLVFSKESCGYGGEELATHLANHKIEVEYYDRDLLVLMLTPELSDSDLHRLTEAFAALEVRASHEAPCPLTLTESVTKISIREAVFADSETISTHDAKGRICASPTVSCPPAIPIVVSGEVIDENAVELLLYYGIEEIEVIK